jgi:membrane associated rhomboid family serine protease
MRWLNKLERRLGRYAIPDLMRYIVILTGVVYGLMYIDRTGVIYSKLVLDWSDVLQGEVWRVLTFIFIPPSTGMLGLFVIYFYYTVGSALENEWGTFRFNIYYLLGILATIVVAFAFRIPASAVYINLSLFLAFARIFPNYELLLFFILPVKVKYLAYLDWFFFAATIVMGGTASRIIAVVSILNYFVFFGADILKGAKSNQQAYSNRQRFRRDIPQDFTYHRCTVCGKTEKDDPKLEFRYCNLCEGDYEYCMEHIRDHEHIRQSPSGELPY